MFIFKFEVVENRNYPKYTIIINSIGNTFTGVNNSFYYLLAHKVSFESFRTLGRLPDFLVTFYLFFDVQQNDEYINFNKFGTDYILNGLLLYKDLKYIGKYPENYILINDFENFGDDTDKSTWKKFKSKKVTL